MEPRSPLEKSGPLRATQQNSGSSAPRWQPSYHGGPPAEAETPVSEIVDESPVEPAEEYADASPAPAGTHAGGPADDEPVTETFYPGREAAGAGAAAASGRDDHTRDDTRDDGPATETFEATPPADQSSSGSRARSARSGLAGALGAGGLFTAASSLKGRRPSPRPRPGVEESSPEQVAGQSAEPRPAEARPAEAQPFEVASAAGSAEAEPASGPTTSGPPSEAQTPSEVRLKDFLGSSDEKAEPVASEPEPSRSEASPSVPPRSESPAVPPRSESSRSESSQPAPSRAEPRRVEPSRTDPSQAESGSGRSFGSRKLVLAAMAVVVAASGAGLLVNKMQPVTVAPTGESDDTATTQGGEAHSAIENPTSEYKAPVPAAPGGLGSSALEPPGEPAAPRQPALAAPNGAPNAAPDAARDAAPNGTPNAAPNANGAPALPANPGRSGAPSVGSPGHPGAPGAGGTLAAPAAPGVPGMLSPMPVKPAPGSPAAAARPGFESAGARGPAAVYPAVAGPSRPTNVRSRSIGKPSHHGSSNGGGGSHGPSKPGTDYSPRNDDTGGNGGLVVGGLVVGVLN